MIWRTECGRTESIDPITGQRFVAIVEQVYEMGPHPFGENGRDYYGSYEWTVCWGNGVILAKGVDPNSRLGAMRAAEKAISDASIDGT